jgi:hypothetical protein
MKTPLEVWPERVFRGSPGYSARHYRDLAGAAEDPLRVAERLLARSECEVINRDTQARVNAGEPYLQAIEWQGRELSKASQTRWERLCKSFDAVIAALESAPQTPVMKQLVRQAKAARKKHGVVPA